MKLKLMKMAFQLVTEAQVNTFMDLVISKNIFISASDNLIKDFEALLDQCKITMIIICRCDNTLSSYYGKIRANRSYFSTLQ